MMQIFVCEDDLKQLSKITTIIKNYILMKDFDMEFALETTKPKEVLDYVKKKNCTGLYFLDVDLKDKMTGISLAAEIRKLDTNGKIVFVTTHSELAFLTFSYKVEAMDYITKDQPGMEYSIKQCIEISNERHLADHAPQNSIKLKVGSRISKFNVEDILFFESSPSPHKLIVHLNNQQIEFYGRLKELEDMNPSFFRCHQSFVVNTKKIKELDIRERIAVMDNGEKCYVSTRFFKKLTTIVNNLD